MKRKKLIKHLESQVCILLREVRNHSLYVNKAKKKVSTIPRHKEIDEFLARKICKDLDIVSP